MLLKRYNTVKARVLDIKFKVIKAQLDCGQVVYVHAPDGLGGSFKPGTPILIERLGSQSNALVCRYRVIALRREGQSWRGANPCLANEVVQLICQKTGILRLDRKEVSVEGCRIDFLCEDQGNPLYVQVKSCHWSLGDYFLFPTVNIRKDMDRILRGGPPYKETISSRAARHLALLARHPGSVLVVLCQGADPLKFSFNPLDLGITENLHVNTRVLVFRVRYDDKGSVFYQGEGLYERLELKAGMGIEPTLPVRGHT